MRRDNLGADRYRPKKVALFLQILQIYHNLLILQGPDADLNTMEGVLHVV